MMQYLGSHILILSLSLSPSWVVPPHSPNNKKNSQLFFVPSPFNLVGNLLQPKSANQAAEDHEIIIMSATIHPLKKKKRIEPNRGTSNSNRSRYSFPKWEKKNKSLSDKALIFQ